MIYKEFLQPTEETLDFLHGIKDYTPEEVNEFCSSFQKINVLTESEVLLEASKVDSIINKIFPEDGSKVIAELKDTGNKVASTIKSNGINKETKKKIYSIVEDKYQKIADEYRARIPDNAYNGNTDTVKFKRAFSLLIRTIFIALIVRLPISILLRPFGGYLSDIIIDPLIFTSANTIAAKGKFSNEYRVICNAFNAVGLFTSNSTVRAGLGLANFVISNVGVILRTTLSKPSVLKKIGLDNPNSKETKDKVGFISHTVEFVLRAVKGAVSTKVFNTI